MQHSCYNTDRLPLWIDEMEMGFEGLLITNERHKVILACSQLKGEAKDWSRVMLRANPQAFPTWNTLCKELEKVFLPPDLEHRNRSKFLACRQGKRSIMAFVQELRSLAAGCASHPFPEEVKVTVFMQNLNKGPPRTQLFRARPKTF